MTEEKRSERVEGSIGVLMLLWGLAPTIAAIGIVIFFSVVSLGSYLGETLVGWAIFSVISQSLWSNSIFARRWKPDDDYAGKVIPLMFLGLLVNGVLVFGGCICVVASSLN